ncbi:small membrane A-kinase anchor protein isoform X2 [Desmodus rotundus]|uniref:small membrane A-kinase anchor protein isoform X2 n=1 Tax=Desmodus rotundus TaxID=9430 RepID=UPI0023812241|nr:small membrane A-kinase anchor protein isoform X2 [Desmodus rotundus]
MGVRFLRAGGSTLDRVWGWTLGRWRTSQSRLPAPRLPSPTRRGRTRLHAARTGLALEQGAPGVPPAGPSRPGAGRARGGRGGGGGGDGGWRRGPERGRRTPRPLTAAPWLSRARRGGGAAALDAGLPSAPTRPDSSAPPGQRRRRGLRVHPGQGDRGTPSQPGSCPDVRPARGCPGSGSINTTCEEW